MSFDGFLSFGGIDLINAQRTSAYVHNLMPGFALVRRTDIYDTIRIALEESPYRTPYLDGADWVETDGPEDPAPRNPTHGFYGLYPLSIEGLGDSTMSAAVVEGVRDGGFVNSERDSTRSIRVHGLLVGADKLAVESGLTWLRNALRTNTCGMHGDQCGYTDLRYFLAPPDVCDPGWSLTDVGLEDLVTVDFQMLAPESSPLIFTPSGGETRPLATAQWSWGSHDDGVIVTFGLMDYITDEVIESVGPLYTSRTNFILNPSFTLDTATWEVEVGAGSGALNRIVSSDREFGRFGTDLGTMRVNYMPDPSFENGDPALSGWRSSTAGGVTSVVDGTAPYGTHVARVAGIAGQTELEVTVLGPCDPGSMHIAFSVKQSTDDVVMTLFDTEGAQVDQHTFTGLGSAWNSVDYAFPVPVGVGYVVALTTAGTQELRVDGMMLVPEGDSLTFFSGDSGADYAYRGGPSGISYYMDRDDASAILLVDDTTAHAGPVAMGIDLRAPIGPATVTLRIVTPEGTVVGSVSLSPEATWTRYFLGSDFGRAVHIEIESDFPLDVDKVILESGPTPNAYFDGDSPAPDGYFVGWYNPDPDGNPALNPPHRSVSRMILDPLPTFSHRDSNARPFISVQSGELSKVQLTYAQARSVALEAQLEPYDRTLHRVSCTTGVQRIRDLPVAVGAATEVDFILTAATPHAFSTQPEVIPVPDDLTSVYYSDDLVNLVPYPSMELADAPAVVQTNLCTNPSAEAATTGWVAVPGTTGVAAVTNPTSTTAFGVKVARTTWSVAATAVGGGMYIDVPVTAGVTYSFSIGHIKASINNRLRPQVEFRSAGATIGTSVGTDFAATAGTVYSATVRNALAPALATIARVTVINISGTGTAMWSIGSYLEMDGIMANVGTYPSVYFDGSSATAGGSTYAWTGTSGLSSSTRSVAKVTGWTAPTADSTGAMLTYRTSTGLYATYSVRHEWTRARTLGDSVLAPLATQEAVAGKWAAVEPGLYYRAAIYARSNFAGQRVSCSVTWYTAAGALISSADGLATTLTVAGTWYRAVHNTVAPPTAAYCVIGLVDWTPLSGSMQIGDYVDADGAMLSFSHEDLPYVDGARTDTSAYDYEWDGTANASSSRRVIAVNEVDPIIDPDLPVLPSPPKPPTVPDLALTEDNNWNRYYVEVPAGNVALWAATVPTIAISSKTGAIRQLRVRFYPNPFGWDAEDVDPTSYCGEFWLSYLPAHTTLTVAGTTQEAWATVAGGATQPANQLLYGTDGTPMEWPDMTCAIAYLITIDVPPTWNLASDLDINLEVNRRE